MIIVPFVAQHVVDLQLQDAQAYARPHISAEHLAALEPTMALTALDGARVIGCGGLVPVWGSRAIVWALVAQDAGRDFVAVHRAVRRFLDASPYRRIEAEVDVDFAAGHRWLQMLGFDLEAPRQRAANAEGRDTSLYARIK